MKYNRLVISLFYISLLNFLRLYRTVTAEFRIGYVEYYACVYMIINNERGHI